MKIKIISASNTKGKIEEDLYNKYLSRLHNIALTFDEFEVKGQNKEEDQKSKEYELFKKKITKGSKVVLLHEAGKLYTSKGFTKLIYDLAGLGSIDFLIGGAYGFDKRLIEDSSYIQISLSKMTYPHRLCKAILIEQIYRAQTIKNNHPYHK